MIKTSIWERYFLREIVKVFSLFVGSFFFLYLLIDYSTHLKSFDHPNLSFAQIALYYLCHFVKRAEILTVFALLVATIKVLCSLNLSNELVALLVGGVKIKRLLRPFFKLACFCTFFLFLNFEYLSPSALHYLEEFDQTYFSDSDKNRNKPSLYHLTLSDGSLLLYKNYNSSRQAFSDVFWMPSFDEVYHAKYLYPHLRRPIGRYVNHIIRNEKGRFTLNNSLEKKSFAEIHFTPEVLESAIYPPDQQAISQLWHNLPLFKKGELTDKEAMIMTHFLYKVIIPWATLLAVIGPAPFCMRFTRNLKVFFIYGVSIFFLITFFTLMDASVVLAETQVGSPYLLLLAPPTLFSLIFGFIFSRLR